MINFDTNSGVKWDNEPYEWKMIAKSMAFGIIAIGTFVA